MITEYLAGTVATTILFAVRTPNVDIRTAVICSVFWPMSILAIAIVMILSKFDWDIDVTKGDKMFNFRRPTFPGTRGFAVTAFYAELKVWKAPKF
jgi:hypothetical protein